MKTSIIAIILSALSLPATALAEENTTYRLTLNSIPAGSSWYQILDTSDWSSPALESDGTAELKAGAEYHVMTFPEEGFVFREWCVADTLLTPDRLGMFTMPAHDATMTGRFEYDPASPPGPGSNHWNPQTGELIIDEFTPGSLSSAIYRATDGNSGKVQMITVAGKINSNDLTVARSYTNCTLIDFSRVTGASAVPSSAFHGTNLETICLPGTIESIGNSAFANCTKLSSITIHSMTPPILGNNVFQNTPEGLVIYVPAATIGQYQNAEGWGDFILLPIQDGVRNISVSLPDETTASDYKDMWLELTNTKSGQRIHYVMTGRTQYTFAGIISDTSWEIILRNERGDIFGRIDNVEVKDEDVSVSFVSLSKPQNVTLAIQTPEGNDVTDETRITWTDTSGNYMSQGASLGGLPARCQVNYHVALSQQLAMSYVTPSAVGYVVQDGDNSLSCRLAAVGQTSVSGRVTDAATGMPLDRATVSASQTFGGKYTKTVNARTDRKGLFTLEIADVPTTLTFAASDYVTKTMTCDPLSDGTTTVTLPDVALSAITGATVSIGFTYTSCSDDEVEAETRDWYSDWQNVSYTLFNVTRNRPVEQYSVQYPQIVLLEDIEDGDMLRLTATSRTNAFMPVDCTVTIARQTASATFGITEPGKIQATFARTGNASVTGSLYDSAGKLVKTCRYVDATLTVSGLADGRYTLVTMGDSNLYNTIYDMAQLPQTGLTEGTDYVRNQVEVKSGVISRITIDEVPTLDESRLYYTGENTSFTVNKTSIVAGNYLTLTGRIDFKSAYAGNVSNVQMIVDLPESCSFVENSVMVGNSTSGYALDGQRLIIPLLRYTDRVRFCIIPTHGGEYAPSALVCFDLDGQTITQPIGSACYEIKNLDFNVPTTICSEKFQVNGIAPGSAQIEVYEDGAVIGNTRALANGTWSAECTLPETYNLTTHTIYAIITTKEGMDIESESAIVELDRRCAAPKTVLMTFYNGWLHKNINVTFDFTNLTINNPEYMFYTKTKLSFVADFTDNNPEHLTDVTLWTLSSNNTETPITMSYDETSGKWIGSHDFDFYTAPINLTLEYTYNGQKLFDRKQLSDFNEERESILTDNLAERANFIEAFDSEMPEDEFTRQLAELFSQEDPDDEEIRRLLNMSDEAGETTGTEMSDEEFDALCQQVDDSWAEWEVNGAAIIRETVLTDYFADPKYDLLSDYEITSELEDGTKTVSKKGLTSVNREELEANGYSAITLDDGSEIYVLYRENLMEIIDCGQLVKYSIIVEHSNSPATMARTNMPIVPVGNYLSFATVAKNAIQAIYYLSTTDERRWLVDVAQKIHEATDGISKFYENFMNDFSQNIQCAYDGLNILCDQEIEDQEALAEAAQDRIKEYTAKIEANKKQREVLKSNRDFVKSSTTISEDQKQRLIKEYDEKIQSLSDENKHLNGKRVGTNTQLNKANSRIASIKEKSTQFRRVHTKIRETLDKFPKRLAKGLRLPKVLRLCGKVAGELGVPLQCWSLFNDMMDMADDISEWIPLMDRIDAHHCYKKDDPNAVICHESIYDRANWHAWHNVGILASEIGAIGFSKAGGVPGSYSWWGEMGFSTLAEWWKYFNDRASLNERTRFWIEVGSLKCNDKDDDNHNPNNKKHNYPFNPAKPILDPSGFVYEAIPANRVEGVQASIYYKETKEDMYGDPYEEIGLWNAKEYAQENPLFTDENGMYRWDVPQGLWQVKFEKSGYETAYSEWLPVPPPQLDVNIAMKQNRQPEIKTARAYEDAVVVEFDKYMMPQSLTTDNISVMQDGHPVPGAIALLDEETDTEGSGETYASKVRFNASEPFAGGEVTLMVNNSVKSYAGIRMQDNYQQTFTIQQEIKQIVCSPEIVVGYGESAAITVSVLPASASAGKPLVIKTSSPMILGVETDRVIIGNDGTAEVIARGELPGRAALTFTVDDSYVTATTIVDIEPVAYSITATPTASIASGTAVDKGTGIMLYCATEGATIHYTLDGSCPCDDTAARIMFDGTPVVIDHDLTIKAIATAPGMDDSDIAEFTYTVKPDDALSGTYHDTLVRLTPSPVRDRLTVTAGGITVRKVTVSALTGTVIMASATPGITVTIDMGTVPPGIYIVTIETDDGACSRKILKI